LDDNEKKYNIVNPLESLLSEEEIEEFKNELIDKLSNINVRLEEIDDVDSNENLLVTLNFIGDITKIIGDLNIELLRKFNEIQSKLNHTEPRDPTKELLVIKDELLEKKKELISTETRDPTKVFPKILSNIISNTQDLLSKLEVTEATSKTVAALGMMSRIILMVSEINNEIINSFSKDKISLKPVKTIDPTRRSRIITGEDFEKQKEKLVSVETRDPTMDLINLLTEIVEKAEKSLEKAEISTPSSKMQPLLQELLLKAREGLENVETEFKKSGKKAFLKCVECGIEINLLTHCDSEMMLEGNKFKCSKCGVELSFPKHCDKKMRLIIK